jgi:hypothetical protein
MSLIDPQFSADLDDVRSSRGLAACGTSPLRGEVNRDCLNVSETRYKTWMPATSAGMTIQFNVILL